MIIMQHLNVPPENHVKVLDGQGWVGLIDHLGSEATIVNAARVSFGKIKTEIDDRDKVLMEYLIANRHTSPLEHLVFTFSIHCPLFVRGQWHRHRTWSYNEISRRYTEIDLECFAPNQLRRQSQNNRQASYVDEDFKAPELVEAIRQHNLASLDLYNKLLESSVCRERGPSISRQRAMVRGSNSFFGKSIQGMISWSRAWPKKARTSSSRIHSPRVSSPSKKPAGTMVDCRHPCI